LLVLSSLLSLFFSLVSLLRRPRPSSFFPYTTLFRSLGWNRLPGGLCPGGSHSLLLDIWYQQGLGGTQRRGGHPHPAFLQMGNDRSEEHTSELQSRENLVCRLLLEKKNPFTCNRCMTT